MLLQSLNLSKLMPCRIAAGLLLGAWVLSTPAHAAIQDCVVGVDSSAVFGRANFGNVNPLATPGGPLQASFTYFAECNRTSRNDPQRVQFQITLSAPTSSGGMTLGYSYSTVTAGMTGVITLDWERRETGVQRGTGTAVFTLNGLSPQTLPGLYTFTQLTSSRVRTCDTASTGCTSYGAARLEDSIITANVTKNCTMAPSVMNFGVVKPSSTRHTDAVATASVLCTSQTPYLVRFSGGNAAPVGQRHMVQAGQPLPLSYQVYADAARTTVLQNTTGLSGTGAGVAQQYALYGRVFSNQFPSPGTYSDTLTMTVEY